MNKSVKRDDIARKLSQEFSLTISNTREIILSLEEALVDFLIEKGQVRIQEFGTFYKTTIKSHVIKQIGTKTPRVVLEKDAIKFRSSPVFRDEIYSRKRTKSTSASHYSADHGQMSSGNVRIRYTPSKPKIEQIKKPAKTTISFNPLRLHPRVKKEDIQKQIKERWIKLASSQKNQTFERQIEREVEIFSRLLGQIKKSGNSSIDFTFDRSSQIYIFSGRPRRQVSHLPREIVKGFLTHLDLEDFHIPQERYKLILLGNNQYDKINIALHSFPTAGGASIHIDIK